MRLNIIPQASESDQQLHNEESSDSSPLSRTVSDDNLSNADASIADKMKKNGFSARRSKETEVPEIAN